MNTMVAHKVAAIPENAEMESRILDEKALNEVFVGEIDSTAPSYFEMFRKITRDTTFCSMLMMF